MSGVTRRAFLKGGAVAAGGLVVGCRTTDSSVAPDAAMSDAIVFDAWINITPDDRILLYVDKVEMGQGTLTAYATLVGEELEVDPQRIEVRHAWVDARFNLMGMQSTGGSTSLSDRWTPLRESAAAARVVLERAGAEQMRVPVEDVAARDGFVVHLPSARRLSAALTCTVRREAILLPTSSSKAKTSAMSPS